MIKYELIGRKPAKYKVEFEGRTGTVFQTGGTSCGMRWTVADDGANPSFFKSRRAAFHFFEHGTKFKLKPVYATRGKSQKRIR